MAEMDGTRDIYGLGPCILFRIAEGAQQNFADTNLDSLETYCDMDDGGSGSGRMVIGYEFSLDSAVSVDLTMRALTLSNAFISREFNVK